jgi:hypothetical protein
MVSCKSSRSLDVLCDVAFEGLESRSAFQTQNDTPYRCECCSGAGDLVSKDDSQGISGMPTPILLRDNLNHFTKNHQNLVCHQSVVNKHEEIC